MCLVLRMANSMSRKNKNYLCASRTHVPAVDLIRESSDRRKFEVGQERKGAEPRAPALNSGYTEWDIFRMTSSPSPNALFALLRCALWRQPTGGAWRGFRISLTGVNARSSCSEPQSLPPVAEVHPPHAYVLVSTVLVPHLVQSFTNSLYGDSVVAEQHTRFARLCPCERTLTSVPIWDIEGPQSLSRGKCTTGNTVGFLRNKQ